LPVEAIGGEGQAGLGDGAQFARNIQPLRIAGGHQAQRGAKNSV